MAVTIPHFVARHHPPLRGPALSRSASMELHRGLRVLAVEVSGSEVRADVYGGAGSVCGTVLYRMATEAAARRRAATLRRWARRGTPVTYVRNGESASLVDEQGFLASRIGSETST